MKLKCYKCGHIWNYQGNSIYYCTCSSCYTKVKIERAIINKDERDKWINRVSKLMMTNKNIYSQ